MSIKAAINHLIANRHSKAGTVPLGNAPLFQQDDQYDRQIKLKADLLVQHGAEVLAIEPAYEDRFQALAEKHDAPDFQTLCLSVQEDLLLLVPDGQGMRLIGGGLFFPSKWALSDKIGRPLGVVHGPVPHYQEKLGATVDRLLTRLPEGQVLLRYNWTLHDDDALFQHPHLTQPHPSAASPAALWFRSERQTLSRVDGAGTVLFAIKTLQAALPDAIRKVPALAGFLHDEIAQMDGDYLAYKSLTDKRDALLAYLA